MHSQGLTVLWPTEHKWASRWRAALCCCQGEEIGLPSMESQGRDLSRMCYEGGGSRRSREQKAAPSCFAALTSDPTSTGGWSATMLQRSPAWSFCHDPWLLEM